MKIKDLIGVLSRFPENLEVATYRERYGSDGLDGFWKDININEQRGFFYEDEDGFFKPLDPEEEYSSRNIKFVVLK
jgi:hypothetical protein